MAQYKSLISGAHGDHGFEAGDLVDVPADKVAVWLEAGLIEPVIQHVEVFGTDGAVTGERAG